MTKDTQKAMEMTKAAQTAMETATKTTTHFKAVLNHLTGLGPPPGPPPIACHKCESVWWCTCRSAATPSEPDAEERARLEKERCEMLRKFPPTFPPGHIFKRRARSRSPRPLNTPPLNRSKGVNSCEANVVVAPKAPSHQSWKEVAKLLSSKVLALERTKTTIQDFMEDDRITVQLPKNTHYLPHFKSVAASFAKPNHRFKIGITNDPHERFCVKSYGYTKEYTQKHDGVRYTGMVVIFVHHQRDAIGAFEESLIRECHRELAQWCTNRKSDFDDHIQYDSGSETDHNSQGPHFLYIAHGKRL